MKNDIKIFLLLSSIVILIVLLATNLNYVYGSTKDWLSQGVAFPEYFRNLFYSTGKILPNFALNIGGGQNIYNFAYYGLLNPYILFSYLLPFIKMIDYIVFINIIIIILDGFLMYKWLDLKKMDKKIVLITSIIFMLSSSIIFQAHRQYIFVNYMPFLILGLISIDKHKKYSLTLNTFLIVMTSFYYSIGALLVLFIYSIYKKIEEKNNINNLLESIYAMIIGILMASILLIPTIMSILSSRGSLVKSIDILSLFIPNINLNGLLYDSYGMGFTSISLLSLIGVFFYNSKERKILSIIIIIILSIPLFIYGLNGMLYLRNKALIPFCPLISLLIASFLISLKQDKINKQKLFILISILNIVFFLFGYKEVFYYLDVLLILSMILIFKKDNITLYIIIIIISFSNAAINNYFEKYVSRNLIDKIYNLNEEKLITDIINKDKTFYRMNNLLNNKSHTLNRVYDINYYQTSLYSSAYNHDYNLFFNNIMNNAKPYRNILMLSQTNNIMFQTLMGVKYIIGDDNIPIGYTNIKDKLYQNNNVLPLGYVSSSLLDKNIFDKLSYPYTNEALLNYIVVKNNENNTYNSNIEPYILNNYQINSDILTKYKNDTLIINNSKREALTLKLDKPIKDKILFIDFNIKKAPSCSNGDIYITINNVTNKLTCREWLYFNNNYNFGYVISSSEDINNLNIIFSKGYFEINNIHLYTLDYKYIKDIVNKIDPFIVDMSKTKGDSITGHINVSKDGYFITTIPYDKGFTILVNNKKTAYEKVNKSFIGFPLKKGFYNINISYQSKGFSLGILGSVIGIILFLLLIFFEKRGRLKSDIIYSSTML